MPLSRRIAYRWLPLAGLATASCLLVYVAVQQLWRHAANDPQVQIARDLAASLASGLPLESAVPAARVDYGASLATFVTVFDDAGAIVSTSGTLHGVARTLPAGVLERVRAAGEGRVSWQPQPGVRLATVIVRYPGKPGGFVMAGRSLQESEERTSQFAQLVTLAWGATLVALLALVAASELGLSRGT